MGWIKDWVNSMFRWFKNNVLMPIINWITDLINKITAELRAMRHQLAKDVAKWLDNDFRFVITVIAVIALGFVWPAIWKKLLAAKEKLMMSAIVQSIKEGDNSIISANLWINMQTLHLILKVTWNDYKEMMGDFAQAVAGLADELGEGSGYILAYFQLNYAIAFNTGALIGMSPETSELTAYAEVADFTRKVDGNFRRYAYDPGLIYKDFLEYVVIPSAQRQADAQGALVNEVRQNYERNVEMDMAITNMETAVDDFIEAMPPEIAEQIEARWAPIRTWMEDNYHFLVDEVLEITKGIKEALELRQKQVEEANAYAMEQIDDPLAMLLKYEYRNEVEQASMREYMLLLTGQGAGDVLKEVDPLFQFARDETMTILLDLARSLPAPAILKYESAEMSSLPAGASTNYTDWFVGEY